MAGPPRLLPGWRQNHGDTEKPPQIAPAGLSSALFKAPWVELRRLEWKPGFQVFLPDGSNFSVTVDGLQFVLEGLGVPGVPSLLDYAWSFSEAVLDMTDYTVHRVFTRNRRIREDRIISDQVAGGLH